LLDLVALPPNAAPPSAVIAAHPPPSPLVAAPPPLTELPRALVRGEGGSARLVVVNERARSEGAHEGMTLAEARARVPSLSTALLDLARVEALEALAVEALLTVSPRLGLVPFGGAREEAALALDLSRLALHGEGLFFVEVCSTVDLDRLTTIVADLDLGPVTLGLADGAFAAACAARLIAPTAHDGQPARKSAPRGRDDAFLAPLPTTLLPASDRAREAFAALGLVRLAQVAALPHEGVQARLGEEGRALVELARGGTLPILATYVPDAEPLVEVDLADPDDPAAEGAHTLDALLFALRAGCMRLLPPLAARGQGVGELEIALEGRRLADALRARKRRRAAGDDDHTLRVIVRPARAEIDPRALFELARATLEGALRPVASAARDASAASSPPGSTDDEPVFAPVARMRLRVTTITPVEHHGERLPFARREATTLPLDVTLARLRGRFGGERVVAPVRHEDPRPDGRGVFRPADPSPGGNVIPNAEPRAPGEADLPELRERLRIPPASIGAVILSRLPMVGDTWPVRLVGAPRKGPPLVVVEVSPPERIASRWWDAPYELVYHWVVASDGTRALFARGAEEGGLRLVGLAD
jgi:hypothetical protein